MKMTALEADFCFTSLLAVQGESPILEILLFYVHAEPAIEQRFRPSKTTKILRFQIR